MMNNEQRILAIREAAEQAGLLPNTVEHWLPALMRYTEIVAKPPAGMVTVTQHDAGAYCRILAVLGMEEEGDAVAEVQRLKDAEEARQPVQCRLTFGDALAVLKAGGRVCRMGWNGKGMYLRRVGAQDWQFDTDNMREDEADLGQCAFVVLKDAAGNFIPWNASQADMLAEDWMDPDAGAESPAVDGGYPLKGNPEPKLSELLAGFEVWDCGEDNGQPRRRWGAKRTVAPRETDAGDRVWTGATPEEALQKARDALGLAGATGGA